MPPRVIEHQGIETIARRMFIAGLLYALAIAYLSLLPFDFQQRSWNEALSTYLRAPRVGSTAGDSLDLSVNLLLYMPLAFLLSAASCAQPNRYARATIALLAFCGCVGLSAVIEFAQLYLPYRASALADLLANTAGALVGCAIWAFAGKRCINFFSTLASGGLRAVGVALAGYAAAILFLSLFPFVFLTTLAELQQKLASGHVALFVAAGQCQDSLRCSVKLMLEILAVVPLGVLSALNSRMRPMKFGVAFACGALLGIVIEALQFFLESGIVQGASVLTRAAGLALGVVLMQAFLRHDPRRLKLPFLPLLRFGAAAYLLLVIGVNGWFSKEWAGWDAAMRKSSDINFFPFYYHLLTSVGSALASTVLVAIMYAPVGLLYWAWRRARAAARANGAWSAACLGVLVAFVVESAKLFQVGLRSDSTSVLIAAAAAGSAFAIARVFADWLTAPHGVEASSAPAYRAKTISRQEKAGSIAWIGSVPIFLAVGVAAYDYPLDAIWLILGLVAYAVLLWHYPFAWLVAIPALLPVLDFARWTGRFFLDEFDLVVLVTLGVGLCRDAANARYQRSMSAFVVLAGILGLSYLISVCIGLYPLQAWDANAFSNYYSHYNALRAVKGAIWALSLALLLGRSLTTGADVRGLFTMGVVAGLAGTIAVIVWERYAFTGLFNFSHEYRVTGPMSALHTGGSSLECYLVTALPFLVFGMTLVRNPLLLVSALVMLGGSVYGVMVTYSRTGYIALAVTLALMFAGFALYFARRKSGRVSRVALAMVLGISAILVAVPIIKGSSARARLAQVETDLQLRMSHWSDALQIMSADWRSSLFGMGLGSYPRTYYLLTSENIRPGTYRYENEKENIFLRLGSGAPIFINQAVALNPYSNYVLSLDLRSHEGRAGAEFTVPICEKWLLGSFDCETVRFSLKDSIGTWQHHEIAFNSKAVGAGKWYARRTIRLALHNPNGIVDVDNVRLIDEDGRNLITNGGFESGNDRWLLTMDNPSPWHIENFWLHIYFEQGWFGLLCVAMLATCALLGAVKRMWRGDLFAGALVASIAGFLVVGVLNSPNDNPRLMFLFLMLCWLSYRIRHTAGTNGRATDVYVLDESDRTVSRTQ